MLRRCLVLVLARAGAFVVRPAPLVNPRARASTMAASRFRVFNWGGANATTGDDAAPAPNNFRFPFDDMANASARVNASAAARAVAALATTPNVTGLLAEVPALRDVGTGVAADNYDRLRALSGAAERALRDLSVNEPLEAAKAVVDVARGALADLGKELGAVSSGLVESEVAAIATELLESGYFDDDGVPSLFPASANAKRVDLGAERDFLGKVSRASELASVAYGREGAAAAFHDLGCSRVRGTRVAGSFFFLIRDAAI